MDAADLKKLVGKAQKGDAESFGKIYELLLDDIFRYIYFKVKSEDANDLCEDVFLKAWEKLYSYKEQKNVSFRSWIFRIAHNTVIDYYRKQKITVPVDDILGLEDDNVDVEPTYDINNFLTAGYLKEALEKLKDEYQQVIVLKYINELDNQEISTIMDKTEGAIRILLHRSLKELRHVLDMLYRDQHGRDRESGAY